MRAIFFVLLLSPLAAQTGSDRDRVVAAEAAITPASAELRRLALSRDESDERYRQRRDAARSTIHKTVDGFVEETNGDRAAALTSDDLSTLLIEQDPDNADPPMARKVVTRGGTGLLVTYTVLGGRHDSSATIRAYAPSATGRYRIVATADDDFADAFKIRSRTVRSPLSLETWLMVWGRKEGFNGTLIRFRLYAFDGETLRTVWSPEDMLDPEVAIRDDGFEIKHLLKDRQPWETVRDEYLLTPDGVLHTGQLHVD